MKRVGFFVLYLGCSLATAETWIVWDKAPRGQVPFYLQPVAPVQTGGSAQSLPASRREGSNTSLAGHSQVPGTLSATSGSALPQSILIIKSQEQFQREVQTQKSLQQLPSYQVSAQEKQRVETSIRAVMEELSQTEAIQEITPALAADPALPINPLGVPRAKITRAMTQPKKIESRKVPRVDSIPLLNIGRERQVSAANLRVADTKVETQKYASLRPLSSPKSLSLVEIEKIKNMPVAKVKDQRSFDLKELIRADALVEKVEQAGYVLAQNVDLNTKALNKLEKEEMLFLQAELLYSKGDQCHAAAGLYFKLLQAKESHYRSTAKLKLGICSHKMGLFSDSVVRLISVLKEKEVEAKREALRVLLSDLPPEHQLDIGAYLHSFRDYSLLAESDKPAFNFVIAKYLADRGDFSQALAYALQVPKDTTYYGRAQYIAGVADHMLGKKENAFLRLQELETYLRGQAKEKSLASLVSLAKARMSFQRRKYKESIADFLKIDRNHPMWIEGLQQQAWAQLMEKDEPGAIGNMHSVHTPFFKHVYKPESYVIRALGYINLCQYADAYKSVKNLEHLYQQDLAALTAMNKKFKDQPFSYYELVAEHLKQPEKAQNLTVKLIREAARQRKFLNHQEAINKTYDEAEQYDFLVEIINKEIRDFQSLRTKAKKRHEQLVAQLASIATDKKLAQNEILWKQQRDGEAFLMDYYDFRIANYRFSKKAMADFSRESQKSLAARRLTLKKLAAKDLQASFRRMEKEMQKMIQNNELLKYEIFSGAGENLRYRVAGGKAEGKVGTTTSELKKDGFNWEFDGEFWEDEVGHYRSSLKNACPKSTASR